MVRSGTHLKASCIAIRGGPSVTTNQETDLHLDERLTKLFKSIESSPVMIMITDSAGIIEKVNRKLCQFTGYNPEELVGDSMSLLGEIDATIVQEMHRKLDSGTEWTGKLRSLKKNGDDYWEEVSIFPIQDSEGMTTHHVKVAEDITLRKNTEEAIRFLAYYDNLTNLPNRRLFIDRLKFSINRNRRDQELLAVMSLDLDNFKQINNALGHPLGDRVLKVVSERFSECLRASDTVAHYSGDSFMILLSKVSHADHVATVAEKLLRSLDEPIALEDQEFHITASAGITLFPEDGDDAASLLKNVGLAIQRAKTSGGNCYHYFAPAMHEAAIKRISLESNLRRGLRQQEFLLQYQPQFDCQSGALSGLEALVRWRDPAMGVVQPVDFIPLSEETGFIVPLTEWVLRTACQMRKEWDLLGLPPVRIAVNLSPRQFLQKNIPQMIAGILQDSRLPATLLEVEITENALTEDVDTARQILSSLRGMGVSIAVDDFGTGYSSLSQLKTYPINVLKIDRSFIKNMVDDTSSAAIVCAVIAMSHEMGLKVIAEGVENTAQAQFLKKQGCDRVQGFLYGKPVDADEITKLFT
jgi:diguanylate cyclase (GGDEF)-like protein/PAS domain S-box-containing protein